MPPSRSASVLYEDLDSDPASALSHVLEAMGTPCFKAHSAQLCAHMVRFGSSLKLFLLKSTSMAPQVEKCHPDDWPISTRPRARSQSPPTARGRGAGRRRATTAQSRRTGARCGSGSEATCKPEHRATPARAQTRAPRPAPPLRPRRLAPRSTSHIAHPFHKLETYAGGLLPETTHQIRHQIQTPDQKGEDAVLFLIFLYFDEID